MNRYCIPGLILTVFFFETSAEVQFNIHFDLRESTKLSTDRGSDRFEKIKLLF